MRTKAALKAVWLAELEACLDAGDAYGAAQVLNAAREEERDVGFEFLDWPSLPTRGPAPKDTNNVWTWTDTHLVYADGDFYASPREVESDDE